jgi:rare lipoprotein A
MSRFGILAAALLALASAATAALASSWATLECGAASWYSDSLTGRKTASGKPYNPEDFVAAHRTLPFGTRILVMDDMGGESVEVTVIDRGPHRKNRIIDLSRAAASKLGFVKQGIKRICIETLQ